MIFSTFFCAEFSGTQSVIFTDKGAVLKSHIHDFWDSPFCIITSSLRHEAGWRNPEVRSERHFGPLLNSFDHLSLETLLS